MKDLNELLQAILDMDAAQRKAMTQAQQERTAKLAALEQQKAEIADACAKAAAAEAAKAAKAAEAANSAALTKLRRRQRIAAKKLEDQVDAKRGEWADALACRALGIKALPPLPGVQRGDDDHAPVQ